MILAEKRVQCLYCGRVRVAGRWTRTAEVIADGSGQCPTCLHMRHAVAELKRKQETRRSRSRARRGYGPAKPGIDTFRGFREED